MGPFDYKHTAEGAAFGAATGGVIGMAAAGPLGAAAGAAVGGAAGAYAGAKMDEAPPRGDLKRETRSCEKGVCGGALTRDYLPNCRPRAEPLAASASY